MCAIINISSAYTIKKIYQKPAILQELLLETKAGTPIPPIEPTLEANPGSFISPGDFSINNEP